MRLPALGVDPAALSRDLTPSAEDDAPRYSGPAAAALELARAEATGLGHNYIGGEHLLLGLLAEPDGAAGRALRAHGAGLASARAAVVAAVTGVAHARATSG